MIIRELEIGDFRSHRETRLDLGEGITVIVGENGSGKTSILEAVNFALFKHKPKGVNVDDLIRREAEEARVSVRLTAGGKEYRVVRARKKGRSTGSSLYVMENGRESLLVKGEKDITREIEKVVGVDGDLFTSAVYIRQGEIDALLGADPAQRKKQVGRLLGVHDIETAHQRMREIITEYNAKRERYGMVPEEIEEKRKSLKETRSEILDLKKEIKELAALGRDLKARLSETQETFNHMEKLKDLKAQKREKALAHTNARNRLKEIESYEKTLEEAREKEKEYQEIEERAGSLREEMDQCTRLEERQVSLKRDREKKRKKLATLEKELEGQLARYSRLLEVEVRDPETLEEALKKKKKEVEEKEGGLDERVKNLSEKLNGLKGQNREIDKAARELEGAGEKCPVCESHLSPDHKERVLKEYHSRKEENLGRIRVLEKELEGLEKAKKEIYNLKGILQGINTGVVSSKASEIEALKEEMAEVVRLLGDTEEKLREMGDPKSELSVLEKKKKGLEEVHEAFITARNYLRKNLNQKDALDKEATQLLEEISGLDAEIKRVVDTLGYEPTEEEFEETKKELESRRERVQKQEVDLKGKETLRLSAGKRLEELETELERLKEQKKEAQRLKTFVRLLEDIRAIFHKDRLQRELRAAYLPLIERYTRQLFDSFNLPYTDLKLTDDFSMVLYGQGGEENVDMLSGGERIAAALALRLGIAEALTGKAGMELIMLDEPTVHLDASRRQDLVEIIKDMSAIPQTIVVTHDKEFEQAADTLVVVEKEGGVSRVRVEG